MSIHFRFALNLICIALIVLSKSHFGSWILNKILFPHFIFSRLGYKWKCVFTNDAQIKNKGGQIDYDSLKKSVIVISDKIRKVKILILKCEMSNIESNMRWEWISPIKYNRLNFSLNEKKKKLKMVMNDKNNVKAELNRVKNIILKSDDPHLEISNRIISLNKDLSKLKKRVLKELNSRVKGVQGESDRKEKADNFIKDLDVKGMINKDIFEVLLKPKRWREVTIFDEARNKEMISKEKLNKQKRKVKRDLIIKSVIGKFPEKYNSDDKKESSKNIRKLRHKVKMSEKKRLTGLTQEKRIKKALNSKWVNMFSPGEHKERLFEFPSEKFEVGKKERWDKDTCFFKEVKQADNSHLVTDIRITRSEALRLYSEGSGYRIEDIYSGNLILYSTMINDKHWVIIVSLFGIIMSVENTGDKWLLKLAISLFCLLFNNIAAIITILFKKLKRFLIYKSRIFRRIHNPCYKKEEWINLKGKLIMTVEQNDIKMKKLSDEEVLLRCVNDNYKLKLGILKCKVRREESNEDFKERIKSGDEPHRLTQVNYLAEKSQKLRTVQESREVRNSIDLAYKAAFGQHSDNFKNDEVCKRLIKIMASDKWWMTFKKKKGEKNREIILIKEIRDCIGQSDAKHLWETIRNLGNEFLVISPRDRFEGNYYFLNNGEWSGDTWRKGKLWQDRISEMECKETYFKFKDEILAKEVVGKAKVYKVSEISNGVCHFERHPRLNDFKKLNVYLCEEDLILGYRDNDTFDAMNLFKENIYRFDSNPKFTICCLMMLKKRLKLEGKELVQAACDIIEPRRKRKGDEGKIKKGEKCGIKVEPEETLSLQDEKDDVKHPGGSKGGSRGVCSKGLLGVKELQRYKFEIESFKFRNGFGIPKGSFFKKADSCRPVMQDLNYALLKYNENLRNSGDTKNILEAEGYENVTGDPSDVLRGIELSSKTMEDFFGVPSYSGNTDDDNKKTMVMCVKNSFSDRNFKKIEDLSDKIRNAIEEISPRVHEIIGKKKEMAAKVRLKEQETGICGVISLNMERGETKINNEIENIKNSMENPIKINLVPEKEDNENLDGLDFLRKMDKSRLRIALEEEAEKYLRLILSDLDEVKNFLEENIKARIDTQGKTASKKKEKLDSAERKKIKSVELIIREMKRPLEGDWVNLNNVSPGRIESALSVQGVQSKVERREIDYVYEIVSYLNKLETDDTKFDETLFKRHEQLGLQIAKSEMGTDWKVFLKINQRKYIGKEVNNETLVKIDMFKVEGVESSLENSLKIIKGNLRSMKRMNDKNIKSMRARTGKILKEEKKTKAKEGKGKKPQKRTDRTEDYGGTNKNAKVEARKISNLNIDIFGRSKIQNAGELKTVKTPERIRKYNQKVFEWIFLLKIIFEVLESPEWDKKMTIPSTEISDMKYKDIKLMVLNHMIAEVKMRIQMRTDMSENMKESLSTRNISNRLRMIQS